MRRVPRKLSTPRPPQGARLLALRQAAGLSQMELAEALAVPQTTIALWERSEKPPRSDVLPKMAKALGVHVEALLIERAPEVAAPVRPVGRLQAIFEELRKLPRRQQDRILDVVAALLEQQGIGRSLASARSLSKRRSKAGTNGS